MGSTTAPDFSLERSASIAAAVCTLAFLGACADSSGAAREIRGGDSFEKDLKPSEAHDYSVRLDSGESALVTVNQMGIDVVVEVRDPHDKLIASIDSPNGRNGDEVVLLEPAADGTYTLRVRPIDPKEPSAKYSVRYQWRRDAAQTAAVAAAARQWLAQQSVEAPASGVAPNAASIQALDRWQNGVRVVGIGEATHGSRELGDLRLSLTKLLIERYGFRVVAVEASADKYRALALYIGGQANVPSPSLPGPGWIWIGQRTQRELIEWVRAWNLSHAVEPVRIVGVDANDNALARAALARFIAVAYRGTEVEELWPAVAAELAAADEQSFVFGDSGVNAETWRLLSRLVADRESNAAPWRNAPAARRADATEALSILAEFAAFNANGDIGDVPRSRDVYMARRVLRALDRDGATEKAIYWAHNAHVVHPTGATRIAGSVLRQELGLAYVAIATTFGEGGFLAQVPNDAEDRLAVSRLPMATGAVEAMLAGARAGESLALWRPDLTAADVPEWFRVPRRMHWVGGLYRPDTDPIEAFQPYTLMSDFDGVAYVPRVAAEDVLAQPRIPARKREHMR
jgi:erythromycin esterase